MSRTTTIEISEAQDELLDATFKSLSEYAEGHFEGQGEEARLMEASLVTIVHAFADMVDPERFAPLTPGVIGQSLGVLAGILFTGDTPNE